ncbi:MAG: hypothetical protein LBP53_00445 [Candidatus Peribacteria bacterium]|jgi:hypothetical protein|nr:hypothetical protein [Candidatus Peribacteria bacterium]
MLVGVMLLLYVWYIAYFLRLPSRDIPDNEQLFLSPANGKIIAILTNPTQDTILYKQHRKVVDNFIA